MDQRTAMEIENMEFVKVYRAHPLRKRVEDCIKGVYESEYGARLTDFPPLLVALIDRPGEPVCAAGLRFSDDGFFSERYLSQPIDALLDKFWATPVGRTHIGEITSLAATKAGISMVLIKHIIDLFRRRSIPWAFFTATERLRASLKRTGVPMLDMGQASAGCVDQHHIWGDYYATNPRVVAVHDSMLSIVSPPKGQQTQGAGIALSA